MIFSSIILFAFHFSVAQNIPFKVTRDDTLRGALSPMRTCYDVSSYDLAVNIDVKKKMISGSCIIRYDVVNDFDSMQVDLFSNYKIEKILFNNSLLQYRRELNSIFIHLPHTQHIGNSAAIQVTYSGMPVTAKNPPWDGGLVWKKDMEGRDWIGVACEGLGAASWWPCKDQLADEPDSMSLHFTVPTGLSCIANGQLRDTVNDFSTHTTTWNWFISYPINLYNVTFNLAHYIHFSDTYSGYNGIPLDYYVLDYNIEKARLQFQQVQTMMACYEKYFGHYPFPKDGYKLVETPYWGMEHQSAIAYGNDYVNNKAGFDYIIIHESAHEWWGNNVSANDYADLWIHESFATYAEVLYLECTKGAEDAAVYLKNLRWQIRDSFPIVGVHGINYDGSKLDGDMYAKGAWVLHTFRSVLNNDSLFFRITTGIQHQFALKTISSLDVIGYINQVTGKDYISFFSQYLYHSHPPVLEYKVHQKGKNTILNYRWKADVPDFTMPVEITSYYSYQFGKTTKEFIRINATADWQIVIIPDFKAVNFEVNKDKFYVKMALLK